MSEDTLKHLDFIQAVVARMASNSFLLKGWSVTLVAAVLAFAATGENQGLAAVALLPALTFWGLDAYYLRQEKLFRALYDAVRRGDVTEGERLSLSTKRCAPHVPGWKSTLRVPPVLALHGMTVVVVGAVVLALWD